MKKAHLPVPCTTGKEGSISSSSLTALGYRKYGKNTEKQ
jgi:hypothetical protein